MSHLFPSILLHLNLILKFRRVEQKRVHFISVLNEDLAFKFSSEGLFALLKSIQTVQMRMLTDGIK